MLDTSKSKDPVAMVDWRDQLAYGALVLFRFPLPGHAALARPCLVLDVEMIRGRRCAVLAPAMQPNCSPAPGRRVVVDRRADWRAAGLMRATRFCVSSRLIVPLEHAGFAVTQSTGTPVLGQLEGSATERMHVERARLHALRDIRADRITSDDRHRNRRGAVRGRDFTVERRYPHRPVPMLPVPVSHRGT